MSRSDAVPDAAYRAIFLGIILYFALVVYSAMTGDVIASLAAEFVFGTIAIGVGVVLFDLSDGELSAALGGAVFLIVGGITQFGALFAQSPTLDQVSSLLVFVGIGLYLYVTWTAE
ncbi:uncharacterized protein Nmag_2820 [Natrialba magadii ATCC 43099]|uniref:Uncharacterized protein n=1 Tax=Natrialba magadii (strain ATCC 43099 / DSM 3394 / CCM 3739 / CIP 104546 / IAM 13178 / JCM 8861 / NBRC 102185 / NCIMB 2190 / MS3) TaxID=547559 RepID=D3SZW4_NATMM|nr:hypothetical protein [Natrialba magadii]ADD06374.1 uncharacterized protein Nmag_2820 [Natrialba magadii ATCC 43099]ELY31483.1 hypothetical protein C500_06306 [Natrialba magadii ATCC 43099]